MYNAGHFFNYGLTLELAYIQPSSPHLIVEYQQFRSHGAFFLGTMQGSRDTL